MNEIQNDPSQTPRMTFWDPKDDSLFTPSIAYLPNIPHPVVWVRLRQNTAAPQFVRVFGDHVSTTLLTPRQICDPFEMVGVMVESGGRLRKEWGMCLEWCREHCTEVQQ